MNLSRTPNVWSQFLSNICQMPIAYIIDLALSGFHFSILSDWEWSWSNFRWANIESTSKWNQKKIQENDGKFTAWFAHIAESENESCWWVSFTFTIKSQHLFRIVQEETRNTTQWPRLRRSVYLFHSSDNIQCQHWLSYISNLFSHDSRYAAEISLQDKTNIDVHCQWDWTIYEFEIASLID